MRLATTDTRDNRFGRASVGIAMILVALGLGACQGQGTVDPNERYQVTAEMRPYRATIPLPHPDPGAHTWTIRMPAGFLEDYMRRGRTVMRIQPNGALAGGAGEATAVLQTWLADRSVRAMVMPTPGGAPADSLTLSYDAYVAVVPDCGDWSGSAGFNPASRPHSDFGCSVNRNIGLMLSDPGDLLKGRTPGPADAARQATVVETYRAGGALGSPIPTNESDSLTGIGE